jgi:hypothetical protein
MRRPLKRYGLVARGPPLAAAGLVGRGTDAAAGHLYADDDRVSATATNLPQLQMLLQVCKVLRQD